MYPRMACADTHGLHWTVILKSLATQTLLDVSLRESPQLEESRCQFVKAWSKTKGFLALSSGESELAAVVRAATEGMGLQSILMTLACAVT